MKNKGFTLIELLLVIAIISLLSSVSFFSFTEAKKKGEDAKTKAETAQVARAIEMYKMDNNDFVPDPGVRGQMFREGSSEYTSAMNQLVSGGYLSNVPDSRLDTYYYGTSGDGRTAYFLGYTNDEDDDDICVVLGDGEDLCEEFLEDNRDDNGGGGDGGSSVSYTEESCFTFSAGTITDYDSSCSKDVVIPPTINGEAVTAIGNYSFYYNQLVSVSIPNSVTSIGYGAFYNNKLTSVSIPNSVENIYDSAFYFNQIESVSIPSSVIRIGSGAFNDNRLKTVTIPDSVTYIGYTAFYYNPMTLVDISSSTEYQNNSFPTNCTVANGCIVER